MGQFQKLTEDPAHQEGRMIPQPAAVVLTELLLVVQGREPSLGHMPPGGRRLVHLTAPKLPAQVPAMGSSELTSHHSPGRRVLPEELGEGHPTPELRDITSSSEEWASHTGEHQGRPSETRIGSWGPRNLHLATTQGLWVPGQPHSR